MSVDSVFGPATFDLLTVPLEARVVSPESVAGIFMPADAHVCSCVDCAAHDTWRSCSDVLYRVRPIVDFADIAEVLCAYPGAAACAAMAEQDRLVVAVRTHKHIHVLRSGANAVPGVHALAAFGSAVHTWLAAGYSPRALTGLALGDGPMARLQVRTVRLALIS